jgi:ubiquinone/menaquinone biosynthesis C-methylase UbiE
MPLFRRLGGRHDLAVSMCGLRMGDRFLQVGCGDGGLLAALAGQVGLTGAAVAVDASPATAEEAARYVLRAGVLVDVKTAPIDRLPFEDGTFDVVVLYEILATLTPEQRVGCTRDGLRVLRDGGRAVAIEAAPRGGLGALLGRPPANEHYRGAETTLKAEGFRAVRTLAERDGWRFTEGVKRSDG